MALENTDLIIVGRGSTSYQTTYQNLADSINASGGVGVGSTPGINEILGAYNLARGNIPFERFFLGGDGMINYALDGRETIALRGYPNQSLSSTDGSVIYNKFTLELRYPITLKPSASIYTLTFLEAGNGYNSFREFNPFNSRRSAGAGVRIFMPAFGLLGIDFGYGFDNANPNITTPNGWETHFVIGQRF